MYVHQPAGGGEIAETDGRDGMIASGAARANVRRPTPKYHRREADLRRRVSAGEFAVGSVLPPEHNLSRMYGVSRHTVRPSPH